MSQFLKFLIFYSVYKGVFNTETADNIHYNVDIFLQIKGGVSQSGDSDHQGVAG